MKLCVMIVPLGIFALCYPASAQSGSRAATALTGPSCPTAGTLSISVLFLTGTPPFKGPNFYFPDYIAPSADQSISISSTSAMGKDLSNAFNIAPPFFQQQLCNLDAVYINPAGCSGFTSTNNFCAGLTDTQIIENSWGYREQPSQFAPGSGPPIVGPPPRYRRYIAISAGAWSQSDTPTLLYSQYETKLLQQLLHWPASVIDPNSHQPKTSYPPKYDDSATAPNTSAMAVLAALAHEFGHVLWYDTFRPTPGGPYDFNTFCRGKFFENSWHDVDPPPIWRKFGEPQNTHKYYDVEISQLVLAITSGNLIADFTSANDLSRKIYRSEGHWASMFAAFSPDEDFVETFKLNVMTNNTGTSPLTSLPLHFYKNGGTVAYTENVPQDLQDPNKKLELKRKINCFGP